MTGLTSKEAARRLAETGPNALPEAPPTPFLRRFLGQFASPVIWLLLIALGVDAGIWLYEGARGFPTEPVAIALILLLNAFLGLYQEYRADAALSKLKELSAPRVRVLRDGKPAEISAVDIVPGDMVQLEAGDRVPADGQIAEATGAMLDESMLTGESMPVEKDVKSEVFAGTRMVRGRATAEITRTGPKSALGKLAASLEGIHAEKTPLERKVDRFTKVVGGYILALAILMLLAGLATEGIDEFGRVLLFTVALAVAAVPEGMPAVLTLTLARGIERMARRKAVVRRMAAVEALGSVTVVATDKTGTLTENRMEVQKVLADDEPEANLAMILASEHTSDSDVGDPLEIALHEYVRNQGHDIEALHREHHRVDAKPFDSRTRFMRASVKQDGRTVHYVKGAPEVILDRSAMEGAERSRWDQEIERGAGEGLRLIALAKGESEDPKGPLRFLGLAMLWDPPRKEVPDAIQKALRSGVRVLMITGDHPATALAVAQRIGIPSQGVLTGEELEAREDIPAEVNVFARVLPEQKLRLVELLQSKGVIVAMTGDGVNDAPALKKSDVGIAMGKRGSDVSREVADLVLLDDNFATLVAAMEEGRGIYANIQKFVRFLFATNLAEVLIVVLGALGAAALGMRDASGALMVPLLAVQLLWINIVTDGPPALALGVDENRNLMRAPPRNPDAPLLDRPSALFVMVAGLGTTILGLSLLGVLRGLGHDAAEIRSTLFQYVALTQIAFAFPSRGVKHGGTRNWALVGAATLCVLLQVTVALVPWFRNLLGLAPLTLELAAYLLVAVCVTWLLAEMTIRTRAFQMPTQLGSKSSNARKPAPS